jgi:hypothetical protein
VHAFGPLSDYVDALRYDLGLVRQAMTGAAETAPKMVFNAIRNPLRAVTDAGELAASVYRTMRPVTETGSPLMKERTLVRKLGVHEVPLSKLKEAAHNGGGALNDAFVAGIAGGLRRYHEMHDVTVGDLHLTMPISVRTEDDSEGGNHITLARFDVPVGMADPEFDLPLTAAWRFRSASIPVSTLLLFAASSMRGRAALSFSAFTFCNTNCTGCPPLRLTAMVCS